MKILIVAAVTLGAVIGLAICVARPKAPTAVPDTAADQPVTGAAHAPTGRSHAADRSAPTAEPAWANSAGPTPATAGTRTNSDTPALPPVVQTRNVEPPAIALDRAVATLMSPQTGYEQRQKVWKELKKSGQLTQAVTALEQQTAADSQSADSMTALGEGYYKVAGATNDVREKAIYAMKADQVLEAALKLDPSNWNARFTKTVGMSYWPPELNQGKEVFEQFQALIKQQEMQPPQPEYAATYLYLGEQYAKAGYPNYAAQVWQRGATLFPNNSDLRDRLAAEAK